MSPPKSVRYLSLCALAVSGGLIGTGWTLHARAQRGGTRPFIPRPGDLRPLSQTQSPAPATPQAGVKSMPAQAGPVGGKADDTARKMGTLDAVYWTLDEKTGLMTVRDFTYRADDMTVTGANGRYNRKSKVLDADNNLVLDNPKHHITGEKAHVDNSARAKLAVFTGSVVIVVKPKDKTADPGTSDVASEKGKGGTITCDRVEDYYKKEFVILSGHLTFKQKITKKDGSTVERTLTADHAEYDGKSDKMHLFAPVDMKDTDNQEAHFKKDVYVGTKEGEETLQSDGPGTLSFVVDNEDDDTADAPAGKKPVSPDKTAPGRSDQPSPGSDGKQNPTSKKN